MLKQKKYVYGEKKRNQLLEGVKRQKEQQTNKKSIMGQKGTIYVYAVPTKLENKRKKRGRGIQAVCCLPGWPCA